MFVVDDIVSYFVNLGIEKIEQFRDRKKLEKFCAEIKNEIVDIINKKYEIEPYFDALSSFYESNKITDKILNRIFNVDNEESVESMIESLSRNFVKQYARYSVYETTVKEILNGIYKIIFNGLNASGVLSDNEVTQLLVVKYGRKSLQEISEVKAMTRNLEGQIDSIKTMIAEKSLSMPYSFNVLSETDENLLDSSGYSEKIKKIEDEIQKQHNFQEAVEEYQKLLPDLYESQGMKESLFADIYINIALCYANLEKYSDAKTYIQRAARHIKNNDNSKLYYVNGYIQWKENGRNSGEAVRAEMLKALSITPKYISAKLLLCISEALLDEETVSIISKLDELKQEVPEDRMGEVLQVYGLVYRLNGQFAKAEEYFVQAEKEERDIANLANLGIVYYCWATQNNVSDKRHLKLNVDYPKMFKAVHYLKQVMDDTSKEAMTYKTDIIEVYISACMICDEYNLIDEIGTMDVGTLDYEAARTLIFYRIRKGDKSALELLQKEDKEFYEVVGIVGECEEDSLDVIMDKINKVSKDELFRYYNLGMRVALNIHNIEKYQLLRSEVNINNIECPYLDLYDAEYNAIIGQEKKSKNYFDKIIYEIDDEYILIPAIKFYKERNYFLELEVLYEQTLKKIFDRKIVCHNIEGWIGEIFGFFIERNIEKALELFDVLDDKLVGVEVYNGIKNNLFYRIMDVKKVLEANKALQESNSDIKLQIDELILLKYDMRFVEAHDKGLKLLNNKELSNQQKIMLLELLSECALFMEDFDKSIEYISEAKDLGKELVYDPVHQLYMSRLLRCGDHDGLKYGVEFQKTHPNITEWLKPITISTTNERDEESLSDEFAEFICEQRAKFQVKLDFYKKNTMSFYQFQHVMKLDMLSALSYPECYGIKIVIGTGNNEEIQKQTDQIGNAIAIDAFTLLFLEIYNLSEILNIFETIYITYSTIEEIEKLYLQNDCKAIINVYHQIKTDLRFEKCPNFANYTDEEGFFHPQSFLDTLEIAKRKNCKFLCFDAMAKLFFAESKEYILGIIPVIQNIKNSQTDELGARMIYNIIDKKLTFVNFNANDIIYALKQTDDQMDNKLKGFLKINRHCDMDSFCRVYLHTIRLLLRSKDENLPMFLEKLLSLMDRVYNWARMEKWRYSQYQNEDSLSNYYVYAHFVIIMLSGLIGLFGQQEKITCQLYCREYKFIPKHFINMISEACDESLILKEDIINQLADAIV